MSESKGRTNLVLGILAVIGIGVVLFLALSDFSSETVIIQLFGLPEPIHVLFTVLVIPIVGSLLTVVIFPRILTPIFVKVKQPMSGEFNNAYIESGQDSWSLVRWLKRAVYTSLLCLGLISSIIGSFDALLFMSQDNYNNLGDWALYSPPVTVALASLLLPLVLGLWATSWSLEDAGMIQYKVPPEGESGFYEVEPIHSKFNGYLKGFAGISSLLFLVTIFLGISSLENEWENALFTLLVPFFTIIQMIPAYMVHLRMDKSYLRMNIPKAATLRKEDIVRDTTPT